MSHTPLHFSKIERKRNIQLEVEEEGEKRRKIINYYLLIIYFSLLFIDRGVGEMASVTKVRERRLQS